jgi:hypothetical protein
MSERDDSTAKGTEKIVNKHEHEQEECHNVDDEDGSVLGGRL